MGRNGFKSGDVIWPVPTGQAALPRALNPCLCAALRCRVAVVQRGHPRAKPQPIRYFDVVLKNGFGVMFDDLLAAGYTLLALAIWKVW